MRIARAKKARPIFPMFDARWDSLRAALSSPFTTQKFRSIVEEVAPEVWIELVARYGPGGKGSGHFYSPANILYNYLNRKSRQGELMRQGYTSALPGWGSDIVMQFAFPESGGLPASEEDIAIEGSQVLRIHLVRERAIGNRKKLLDSRRRQGLACDLCSMDGKGFPDEVRESVFECHHDKAPLSTGERATELQDLALLCACCHRALHSLVRKRKHWLTVEEARLQLMAGQPIPN